MELKSISYGHQVGWGQTKDGPGFLTIRLLFSRLLLKSLLAIIYNDRAKLERMTFPQILFFQDYKYLKKMTRYLKLYALMYLNYSYLFLLRDTCYVFFSYTGSKKCHFQAYK